MLTKEKHKYLQKKLWDHQATERWLMSLWDNNKWHKSNSKKILELLATMLLCYKLKKNKRLKSYIHKIHQFIQNNLDENIVLTHPMLVTRIVYLYEINELKPNYRLQKMIEKMKKRLKQMKIHSKTDAKILCLLVYYNILSKEKALEYCQKKLITDSTFMLLNKEEAEQQIYLWFLITSLGKEGVPEILKESAKRLKMMFTGYMLASCQDNELTIVTLILRAMIYIKYEEDFILDGIEFLSVQQRSNGSFGLIHPILKESFEQLKNIQLEKHLPITQDILWVYLANKEKEFQY